MYLHPFLFCVLLWCTTAVHAESVPAVTIIFDVDYIPGALALHQSLRIQCDKTCDASPFILMYPSSLQKNRAAMHTLHTMESMYRCSPIGNPLLNRLCIVLVRMTHLFHPPPLSKDTPARFSKTFDKLNVFDPQLYLEHLNYIPKRIVYFDADTLAMHSCISNLFLPHEDMTAFNVPAFSTEMLFPDTFNTGVMIVQPDEELFRRFTRDNLQMLEDTTQDTQYNSEEYAYDGGDQGVLNRFFASEWTYDPENPFELTFDARHRLPFRYNAQLEGAVLHGKEWLRLEKEDICLVHFSGLAGKPFVPFPSYDARMHVTRSATLRRYHMHWHTVYDTIELMQPDKPFIPLYHM